MSSDQHIWPIKGGVHPRFHKRCSTQLPIGNVPIPPQLVIPVAQHIGEIGLIKVACGDYVYKGQALTDLPEGLGVVTHASSSGTVVAIEERPVPHSSGLEATCVIIDTDGKDDWGEHHAEAWPDYTQVDTMALCERIRASGLVGLGGAAFPFAAKLAATRESPLETLIVNAVECEPYISCDDMLMREFADEVMQGIRILQHILKPQRCLIGIEDNKPEALFALQQAQQAAQLDLSIISIPAIYPSGDEKQLIKTLTGKELKKQELTFNHGILMHNVATVRSVYQAIVKGHPLISRIVTVTGRGIRQPQNFAVLIGTPVKHVTTHAGGYTELAERLIVGGPMMGYPVKTDSLPVVKAMNCLLVAPRDDLPYSDDLAMPCIRCGQCAEACPVELLPQQLYWYSKAKQWERLQDYDLFDCIECGCCAYVCPSDIPLVAHYRFAKSAIRAEQQKQQKIDLARERFEFHEFRKQREKRERDEKRAQHKAALQKKKAAAAKQKSASDSDTADGNGNSDNSNDAKQDAIKAAMARAQAKKQQRNAKPRNTENLTPDQQRQIEEAEQRRKANQ